MAKAGVALEFPRAVVLRDPRKPANLAPMLEDVSRLGSGVRPTDERRKELEGLMRSFECRCTHRLNLLLYLHALRYGEGYYNQHDPDLRERDRMNVLICYSIYVSTRVELLYARVQAQDDSGVSALFATALKEANALFGNNASRMDVEELVSRYALVEPLLSASLSRNGLAERIIPNAGIFNELKQEALRRFNLAMDRIYGPEEAA